MRARHVVGALISAVTVAGCSNTQSTEPAGQPVSPLESAAAAASALPTCSEVFVPGHAVDEKKALAGCLSKRGVVQGIGFFECNDGTVLFQVDASTGAPNGYGFGGKKYVTVKGESAADKGYKKAYQACHSDKPAAARNTEEDSKMTTIEPAANKAAATATTPPGRVIAETVQGMTGGRRTDPGADAGRGTGARWGVAIEAVTGPDVDRRPCLISPRRPPGSARSSSPAGAESRTPAPRPSGGGAGASPGSPWRCPASPGPPPRTW
jgi:hypothetical protein